MELRQLQYFAAVVRHGSFTAAADELWLTQSALSQQVRRLEAEMGVRLLERGPRGVRPTAAGEALLPRAEAILAQAAAARAELDEHAGAARGRVAVAAAPGDAVALPAALAAFHGAHPGSPLRAAVLGACQAAGFSPVPLFEVGDPATVRHLVAAGLGVALVPGAWLALDGPPVAVRSPAPAPAHEVAVLAPDAGPSAAGRLLLEQVVELADEPPLGA